MPEGPDRWGHCLVGNHIVDHMEALNATCCKQSGCTCCVAKQGQLATLRQHFERKTTGKVKEAYNRLLDREAFLCPDGFILNQAALDRAEHDFWSLCFIKNAFWEFRYEFSIPDVSLFDTEQAVLLAGFFVSTVKLSQILCILQTWDSFRPSFSPYSRR